MSSHESKTKTLDADIKDKKKRPRNWCIKSFGGDWMCPLCGITRKDDLEMYSHMENDH